MKRNMLFAAFITLALYTTAHAQTVDKAKIDQFFDRLAEKNKAMGSLIIARDGNTLYTKAIGYSEINGADKKPLTMSTKYRIGSVTKMFTASMIFQLIEEGKLNLDDHLDRFFPQIPNASKITIRQILGHRSGIHDLSRDQSFRDLAAKGVTKEDMIALLAKSNPDFEPDEKYMYSNSGYFVLGNIIEKVTGKSYEENLQQRIASRIGLQETYPITGKIDVTRNESQSFRYLGDWKQEPEVPAGVLFGSGFLISTAPEQARFIQALFTGKLVSLKSLNQMKEGRLGMDTFTYNGKTFYGHTGGINGFGSWLVYQPEEKLALSYTTNGKVYPVASMIDNIFDIYYHKPFTIPSFEAFAVSTDLLDKYVGVYATTEAPVKFTITRKDATLLIQPPGETPVPLEATADDQFRIQSAGVVITFDASKNQMTIIRNGRERVFTKEN